MFWHSTLFLSSLLVVNTSAFAADEFTMKPYGGKYTEVEWKRALADAGAAWEWKKNGGTTEIARKADIDYTPHGAKKSGTFNARQWIPPGYAARAMASNILKSTLPGAAILTTLWLAEKLAEDGYFDPKNEDGVLTVTAKSVSFDCDTSGWSAFSGDPAYGNAQAFCKWAMSARDTDSTSYIGPSYTDMGSYCRVSINCTVNGSTMEYGSNVGKIEGGSFTRRPITDADLEALGEKHQPEEGDDDAPNYLTDLEDALSDPPFASELPKPEVSGPSSLDGPTSTTSTDTPDGYRIDTTTKELIKLTYNDNRITQTTETVITTTTTAPDGSTTTDATSTTTSDAPTTEQVLNCEGPDRDTSQCAELGDPENEEIPEKEIGLEVSQSPFSMSGNGQCVPNITASIMGQSFTVDMSEPCSIIYNIFRPFIILLASIAAVGILLPRD